MAFDSSSSVAPLCSSNLSAVEAFQVLSKLLPTLAMVLIL